jgi:hypothetical protein
MRQAKSPRCAAPRRDGPSPSLERARSWIVPAGYGVPYTVVRVDGDAPADLRPLLWERRGVVGRFSAILVREPVAPCAYQRRGPEKGEGMGQQE